MRYIPESIGEQFEQLEAEQVYVIGEYDLIQWHKSDYTLVAQAVYDIIGTYDAASETFQAWETKATTTVSTLALEAFVQNEAERSGPVAFICEERDRFYAVRQFEALEIERTFPEEVIHLRKLFIDCMIGLEEGREGEEEHIALVEAFRAGFEDFLDRYKQQSIGTFAAYIAELGVEHGQALSDVVRISNLYA